MQFDTCVVSFTDFLVSAPAEEEESAENAVSLVLSMMVFVFFSLFFSVFVCILFAFDVQRTVLSIIK